MPSRHSEGGPGGGSRPRRRLRGWGCAPLPDHGLLGPVDQVPRSWEDLSW